jgi:FKBP-type peptidyl-prolyl cis-trans isomerase FkpA
MKQIFYWMVPLVLLAGSCGGGPSPGQDGEEAAAAPTEEPVDEDEVIMRLSGDLVAAPRTQAEKDRNTIVNYALDSLLDVRATESGLYYQIRREGKGEPIEWGDRLKVHYKGYFLESGRVFDSSYRRGEPIEFYVGNMIDGWNEGLQLLRPGAEALFLVPSHLAYGEEGFPNSEGTYIVPPNKVLAFEVEVLEKMSNEK